MTGSVDEAGRALLTIHVRDSGSRHPTSVIAWIDTGFTGGLVLPRSQIWSLGLSEGPIVGAVLADGSELDVSTYKCQVEWFGEWKAIEVVANDGQFPLLGVVLLEGHQLHINYVGGTVTVT